MRKWALKYDWRNRLTQLRLCECEQVVAAEQEARQRVAEITELERASVARRTFDTAHIFEICPLQHAPDSPMKTGVKTP